MGLISIPLVCFLSIVFVYTLSINVLDVSQTLVGSVILGAKPDEMTLSKNIHFKAKLGYGDQLRSLRSILSCKSDSNHST